jgi:hypothetical protein
MLDLLRTKTPRMIRLAPANHCINVSRVNKKKEKKRELFFRELESSL